MDNSRWPRHYAEDYFKATTPEGKKAALKGCPVEWRELVRRTDKKGVIM